MFPRAGLPVLLAVLAAAAPAQPPAFTISGDWEVTVTGQTLHIAPPVAIQVKAEKYTAIPVFNPKAGGWVRGAQLNGVKAQETTSPHLLEPGSFTLRGGSQPDSPVFTPGTDYELDPDWRMRRRTQTGPRLR